jgi:hypothetical protein
MHRWWQVPPLRLQTQGIILAYSYMHRLSFCRCLLLLVLVSSLISVAILYEESCHQILLQYPSEAQEAPLCFLLVSCHASILFTLNLHYHYMIMTWHSQSHPNFQTHLANCLLNIPK